MDIASVHRLMATINQIDESKFFGLICEILTCVGWCGDDIEFILKAEIPDSLFGYPNREHGHWQRLISAIVTLWKFHPATAMTNYIDDRIHQHHVNLMGGIILYDNYYQPDGDDKLITTSLELRNLFHGKMEALSSWPESPTGFVLKHNFTYDNFEALYVLDLISRFCMRKVHWQTTKYGRKLMIGDALLEIGSACTADALRILCDTALNNELIDVFDILRAGMKLNLVHLTFEHRPCPTSENNY